MIATDQETTAENGRGPSEIPEPPASVPEYNYQHFRTRHLLSDVQGTVAARGVPPGEMAPEFELPRANGGTLRLRDLRGRPVLLHFGSYT